MRGTLGASVGKWGRRVLANSSDAAFTVNQKGSGDILDLQAAGVSVFSVATSGTITFSGSLDFGDDAGLLLGANDDISVRHRGDAHNANTVLAGAIVGTGSQKTLATAADSLIIGAITASGDLHFVVNKGGESHTVFLADGSTGDTILNAASGASVDHYIDTTKVLDHASGLFTFQESTTVSSTGTLTLGAITLSGAVSGGNQAISAIGDIDSDETDFKISANDQGAGNNTAGRTVALQAGQAGTQTTGAAGGNLNLTAGAAGGTDPQDGGDIVLTPGVNTSTGRKGQVNVIDDFALSLGTTLDGVLINVSAGLTADTALANVLIGTPITPAIAANSLVISNVTSDGDILIAANDGGTSWAGFFMDASAGVMYLTPTVGGLMIGLAADAPAPDSAVVHIWNGTAGSVAADGNADLVIESAANVSYIHLLGPTTSTDRGIVVGEPGAATRGAISYEEDGNRWRFMVQGADRLRLTAASLDFQQNTTITSTGSLTINAFTLGGNITVGDGLAINTGVADNDFYTLGADDIGVGIVEMARIAGAADPYVQIGRDDTGVSTNTVTDHFRLQAGAGGAVSANFGLGISILLGNDQAAEVEERVSIDFVLVTATNGSEDARIDINLMEGGGMAKSLTFQEGSIFLVEKAAAIADVAAEGQLWVKSQAPNELWFTDDAGNDLNLSAGADFAGLTLDGGGAITIDLQHGWQLIDTFDTDMPENISNGANGSNDITIGATGTYMVRFDMSAEGGGANKVYEVNAFAIAASASSITSTTEDNPVAVNATSHGFTTNNKVKITGVTTADELNDRIFTVTRVNDNQFTLQEDNGGNVNGAGFGVGSGGTAALATICVAVHSHRKFAAADVGCLTGGGIVNLTGGETLELYVKGITDASDITVEHCSFMMQRMY